MHHWWWLVHFVLFKFGMDGWHLDLFHTEVHGCCNFAKLSFETLGSHLCTVLPFSSDQIGCLHDLTLKITRPTHLSSCIVWRNSAILLRICGQPVSYMKCPVVDFRQRQMQCLAA